MAMIIAANRPTFCNDNEQSQGLPWSYSFYKPRMCLLAIPVIKYMGN